MQKISTNEIRQKYLTFFRDKANCVIIESARLVPENDPTTLFTGSGMQPMVPYLLGQTHPLGARIADSQKCFRSQDIEEVGDNRHTTFFEMLGDWSLGDFFKKEQISFMWEFLTEEIKLDPKRLYFSAFAGNDTVPRDVETAQIWQSLFAAKNITANTNEDPENLGIREGDKIFFYGEKKNWWSRVGVPSKMPVGEPGGPDTEMFYDFNPELGRACVPGTPFSGEFCNVNCDCGRFMEIGNNVFMEYMRGENGFEKLAQQNVDYGGGLERLAASVNDNADVFMLDIFESSINKLEDLSGKNYTDSESVQYSFRVILDHIRAATFLIGDEVFPSNKDQGYFVRRLIRRAVRMGKKLGIENNFTKIIADEFVNFYEGHYTDFKNTKNNIFEALDKEETQFEITLEKGLKEFEKAKSFKAKDLFFFYQSLGFPFELMLDIMREKNITFNYAYLLESFEAERKAHADLSRSGAEQKFKGGLADTSEVVVKYHTATHLLHQALREVLGDKVFQKGSNLTAERLRFDFSYDSKMTDEQKAQVEQKVNAWIKKDMPVKAEDISQDEAKKRGAIGLFGEKYGDIVKVYTIGTDINRSTNTPSIEFCGGPHVEHTGVIGTFKIIKEEAVSAGVRRIKAVIS